MGCLFSFNPDVYIEKKSCELIGFVLVYQKQMKLKENLNT